MYPREAIDFERPYVSPYLRRPLRSVAEVFECRAIRSAFTYEPDTGLLRWRKAWSGKAAGSIAGSLDVVHGYTRVRFRKRYYKAHRVIWMIVHGHWPVDQIDHINGIRTDNRLCNLRACTQAQNNCAVIHKKGQWPRGVAFEGGRWVARTNIRRKYNVIGKFDTMEEASAAYEAEAKRVFGEFYRPPVHRPDPARQHRQRIMAMREQEASPSIDHGVGG